MIWFVIVLLVVVVVAFLSDHQRLKQEVLRLSDENSRMNRQLRTLEGAVEKLLPRAKWPLGEITQSKKSGEVLPKKEAAKARTEKVIREVPQTEKEAEKKGKSQSKTSSPESITQKPAAAEKVSALPKSPAKKATVEKVPLPKEESKLRSFFINVARKLQENWSGVLGTIVLTAGIGYLGTYSAFKVSPFVRYIIILAASAGLVGAHLFLRRREYWRNLSDFILSASGAVVMFANVGASSVQWLKWIENDMLALIFVGLGIAYNLFLAIRARNWIYSAFHYAIGIFVLFFLPVFWISISIAAVIQLLSLFFVRRTGIYQPVATGAVFLLYLLNLLLHEAAGVVAWIAFGGVFAAIGVHIYLLRRDEKSSNPEIGQTAQRILLWVSAVAAIFMLPANTLIVIPVLFLAFLAGRGEKVFQSAGATLVFLISLLRLYFIEPGTFLVYSYFAASLVWLIAENFFMRTGDESPRSENETILCRALIWASLVAVMFLVENVYFAIVPAAAVLFLLYRMKSGKVRTPVQRADFFGIQALFIASLVFLHLNSFPFWFLSAVFWVESAILQSVSLRSGTLVLTFARMQAFFALFIVAISTLSGNAEEMFLAPQYLNAVFFLFALIQQLKLCPKSCLDGSMFSGKEEESRSKESNYDSFKSLYQVTTPEWAPVVFLFVLLNYIFVEWWSIPLVSFALIFLGEVSRKKSSAVGQGVRSAASVVLGILFLVAGFEKSVLWNALGLFSMLLLFIHHIWRSPLRFLPESESRWPIVYIASAVTAVNSFSVLESFSSFLWGLSLLLLMIPMREIARFLAAREELSWQKAGAHLLSAAWIFFGLFTLRHILVHIQSEASIFLFSNQLWIALFALAVLVQSYLSPISFSGNTSAGKWAMRFEPFYLEAFLAFAAFVALKEIPGAVHSSLMSGGSVLLLLLSIFIPSKFSRLRLYSLLVFLMAAVYIGFLAIQLRTPSGSLFDAAWFHALFGTLFLAAYVVVWIRFSAGHTTQFPELLSRLRSFDKVLSGREVWYIYYPFAASVALYLYWSFAGTWLTLFWSLEAFVIYLAAFWLRENMLRMLSSAGVAAVLARLIFFDLANTSGVTRAAVFIGVGLVLIAMNAVYAKYHGRIKGK